MPKTKAKKIASVPVIHEVEQGTEVWHALRSQFPLTASEAQAIANNGKGLETLCWTKLAERHSAAGKIEYTNGDLDRGHELEQQARSLYELETGNTVEQVGFVTNESISKVAGCSPDGLVGTDGLVEIKSPNDVKHFRMAIEGAEAEPQYMWQIQMQLLMTNRTWCDLVLYNPNFERSLLVKRITSDEEMQTQIKDGLKKGEAFISEIEKKLS